MRRDLAVVVDEGISAQAVLDALVAVKPASVDHIALFDVYRELLPSMGEWARARYPKDAGDSDFVYKQTIKAKACDSVRGVLPAATIFHSPSRGGPDVEPGL